MIKRSIWLEFRLITVIGAPGGNFLPPNVTQLEDVQGDPFHQIRRTSPLLSTAKTSMKFGSRVFAAILPNSGNFIEFGLDEKGMAGSMPQSFHDPFHHEL